MDEAGITSIEVLQSVIEEVQAIGNDSGSSISSNEESSSESDSSESSKGLESSKGSESSRRWMTRCLGGVLVVWVRAQIYILAFFSEYKSEIQHLTGRWDRLVNRTG